MPPKKKKKGKLSKAEKEKLKREEEERRAQEEELARKEAEEEEQRRLEQERLEREERERIKAEEAKIRNTQRANIQEILDIYTKDVQKQLKQQWEEIRWQRYLYQSNVPDPLDLPEANSYLAKWRKAYEEDIHTILKEAHLCLALIEEVESALLSCPSLEEKIESSWRETRKNLQELLQEKMNMATYDLLVDADKYINPDTSNLEYHVSDLKKSESELNVEGNEFTVNLSLWANITKNPRYKGLDMPHIGYGFELPRCLLTHKCAVRMLHTVFDHISPAFLPPDELAFEKVEEEHKKSVGRSESSSQKTDDDLGKEPTLLDAEKMMPPPADDNQPDTARVETAVETLNLVQSLSQPPASPKSTIPESIPTSSTQISDNIEATQDNIVDKGRKLEEEKVDLSGYTILGGVVYFELLEMPPQPIQVGSWVLTYVEKPQKLIKIPYKACITSIRQPKAGMTPAEAAEFAESEIKRYESEMANAIAVTIRLPCSVLYLDQPAPAFWDAEKGHWTFAGFFDIRYEEEKNSLFFKTNQFGIIGVVQRKYPNLPLQSWELRPGSSPKHGKLTVQGSLVMLEFEISEEGCCISVVQQADRPMFTHLYKQWMPPQLLLRKLSALGINVTPERNASEHIGIPPKHSETEDWIYQCMALLSPAYIFHWSRFNAAVPSDQLIFRFSEICEPSHNSGTLALVTPERSLLLKCTEISQTFSDEPLDNMEFFGDVYHLLLSVSSEETKKKIKENNGQYYNNVYSLLSFCRPLSFS